jgi:hypothetical protein
MCRRELGATTCLSNDVPAVLVSLVKRVVIHRVTPESTSLLALQRGALAGLAQLAAHSGGKTALRLAQAIPGERTQKGWRGGLLVKEQAMQRWAYVLHWCV